MNLGYNFSATSKYGDIGATGHTYDPDFGARPLKRTIQRELQDPLALKILSGEFHEGETIKVDRGEDGLTFTADEPVIEGKVVAEEK